MKKIETLLDLSNFPREHQLFNNKNKKKLGFMKDEAEGKIIEQFVGLKSKLYSIKYNDGNSIKRCKGLQNVVLKKFIQHENYKEVLNEEEVIVSETRRIEAKLFSLRTIKTKKVSHTAFDDKRFLCPNKIDTLPYGYKKGYNLTSSPSPSF